MKIVLHIGMPKTGSTMLPLKVIESYSAAFGPTAIAETIDFARPDALVLRDRFGLAFPTSTMPGSRAEWVAELARA